MSRGGEIVFLKYCVLLFETIGSFRGFGKGRLYDRLSRLALLRRAVDLGKKAQAWIEELGISYVVLHCILVAHVSSPAILRLLHGILDVASYVQ